MTNGARTYATVTYCIVGLELCIVSSGLLSGASEALGAMARAAVTPLVPDDYLDLVAPLNGSCLRARIVSIDFETPNAATLVLRPGRRWQGHTPGQYLRVGVDIDGVRHWRSYSVTSRPEESIVSITVKEQGLVSGYLLHRARPGEVIQLDQAAGEFCLPEPVPSKALFITAGSGITPVMGMLRSASLPDAVVLHSALTRDEVIFGDELRAMARAGEIRLIERHTDADGMLTMEELAELVPDIEQRQTWVCGPAGLIEDVQAHYASVGWASPQIELFRPALAEPGEGGTVRFDRSGAATEAAGDTALLDAGESVGVLMPSGCRMGICYGCVIPLTEGSVRDLRDGAMTSVEDGEPVLIQTCINAAAGPCALDI